MAPVTIAEHEARAAELGARIAELDAEAAGEPMNDEQRTEWNRLNTELDATNDTLDELRTRHARLAAIAANGTAGREAGDDGGDGDGGNGEQAPRARSARRVTLGGSRVPENLYDLDELRRRARSENDRVELMREAARRSVDREPITGYPGEVDEARARENVERLLARDEAGDQVATLILSTGSAAYRRAFGRTLVGLPVSAHEQDLLHRAMSLTTTAGGFAVPYTLDPSVLLTSNGVVNPLRQIARVEQITGNTWNGVSSAGITAAYAAEATEASDDAPTIAQPTAVVEKAQAFVPFSIEIGEDWTQLQAELTMMLTDAKDTLEADKFLTGVGHGSNVPEGLLVGGTAIVTTAATATFAVADLYSLRQALPPRFQPRARYLANSAQYDRVRQFDTSGGASLWTQLEFDRPANLLGKPAHELSTMTSAVTAGSSILTFGDFSRFLIVDRIGMTVELVPHLFATNNNRPSGQRGFYAYWRNTSEVLTWQAFRTLKTL